MATSLPVADDRARAGSKQVLLVCPPFQNPYLSCLSVTHLATLLRERGGRCREAYPHFDLVSILGAEKYLEVGDGTSLAGELLFAEGLHGEPADPALRRMLEALGSAEERRCLRERFEERCLSGLDLDGVEIVGFTTSFNQLMASLFIARSLRARAPAIRVVLGGAACGAPMGAAILEAYPEVDFVVGGWGELPLLALSRGETLPRWIPSPESVVLDGMPIPDFTAFVNAARAHDPAQRFSLTFESSRGCWWGQKNHCRFCGINGEAMAFNAKSSARVVDEVTTLWRRHGRDLMATDAILSLEHLKHVIPELGRLEAGPKIFYEMKCNMSEAQVIALARARIQGQPGIESLSTHLLQLLKKGTTCLGNLAFLKWCAERRVAVSWNLLYAIPGERPEDYDEQIALMGWIPHFPPADRINPIHLARYSPYFEHHEEYGWRDVRPSPEYFGMHPHLPLERLYDIANYYVGDSPVATAGYAERFGRALAEWDARNRRGEGLFLDREHGLVRNGPEGAFRFQMSPVLARILEQTHEVVPVARVLEHAGCSESVLAELEDHGIVRREGDKVLNLALRTGLDVR